MNKKTFLLLSFAVALLTSFALCAETLSRTKGKEAKIFVRVIDTEGNPVPDATITARFRFMDLGRVNKVIYETDKDGRATVKGKCVEGVDFEITKPGWYIGNGGHSFLYSDKKLPNPPYKDGKWLPYGVEEVIVLKKKIQPVAMVFVQKWFHDYETPELDKDYGWDMELDDFVEPLGKGKVADFYVRHSWELEEGVGIKKGFTISFPNCLDGYYMVDRDHTSELTTPLKADVDAKYEKTLALKVEWGPDTKFIPEPHREPPYYYAQIPFNRPIKETYLYELPKSKVLIMRTRSKVDENGTLVSAHYSYYLGPIVINESILNTIHSYGTTYFNPYENNTSLEYDRVLSTEYEINHRENLTETQKARYIEMFREREREEREAREKGN